MLEGGLPSLLKARDRLCVSELDAFDDSADGFERIAGIMHVIGVMRFNAIQLTAMVVNGRFGIFEDVAGENADDGFTAANFAFFN